MKQTPLMAALAVGLVLGIPACLAAPARAAETGLIETRAGDGYWVTFAHPVQAGVMARVRAFADGEDIGEARVAWASPVAPYEAYVTGAHLLPGVRAFSALTPYERVFERRPERFLDVPEPIRAGYYVVAPSASAPEPVGPVDSLRATLRLLATREDVQAALRGHRAAAGTDDDAVFALAEDRSITWRDPVTARLFRRLADLASERGLAGGPVPAGWFPPEAARQQRAPDNAPVP